MNYLDYHVSCASRVFSLSVDDVAELDINTIKEYLLSVNVCDDCADEVCYMPFENYQDVISAMRESLHLFNRWYA